MQNEEIRVKHRRISKLAQWLTLGAALWLWFTHYVLLAAYGMYEAICTFPIWIAGIASCLGLVLSIAKIATSPAWKGRLLGVLFIVINLTVIAMSAFSIALSFVKIYGG